jgi:epoxyqueuosine reductase QueG
MLGEKNIRNVIEKECEDYFLGMVDLSGVRNSLTKKYGLLITEYPRAISIGVTLPLLIVNELSAGKEIIYNETYCHLKSITAHLSSLLEFKGYRALAMPKSKNRDKSDISFHEVVANLADLGEIRKNSLITPEVGSRVKWGTILTDAPLKKLL